jgi:hypothetical protein
MSQDEIKNNGHEKEEKNSLTLNKNRPIFQGTGKRNIMMQTIIQYARELLPMTQKEFVDTVSFNTGLTPRTLQESYLDLLLNVHILQMNKNCYELGIAEKGL